MPTTGTAVNFVSCTQAQYNTALSQGTLDANTLYFTTTDSNMYLGNSQFTDKYIERRTSPPTASTAGTDSKLYYYYDSSTGNCTIYDCKFLSAGTYRWTVVASSKEYGSYNVESVTSAGSYATGRYELDEKWCYLTATCDLPQGQTAVSFPLPVAATTVAGAVSYDSTNFYYVTIPSSSSHGYLRIERTDGQAFISASVEITLVYKYSN